MDLAVTLFLTLVPTPAHLPYPSASPTLRLVAEPEYDARRSPDPGPEGGCGCKHRPTGQRASRRYDRRQPTRRWWPGFSWWVNAALSGPLVWGVDLGTSAAQSAIACYAPETGALACLAAFPCQPSLDERGRRDGVAGLYRECARRGELLTLGQRATDVPALLAVALERFGCPSRVVADRWGEAELRDALDKAGIPSAAFETRGMGFAVRRG